MKKLRTVILAISLMAGVNASYSQFYDVKIVKSPKTVGTRREPTPEKEAKNSQTSEKSVPRSEKMHAYALRGSESEKDLALGKKEGKTDVPVSGADVSRAGTDVAVSESDVAVSEAGIDADAGRPMFSPPLKSLEVSSPYGYRKDPFTGKRKFHAGTDYRTAAENVYAMMPGRIRKIGYDRKLGNFITLDHGDIQVTYAHLHTVVGRKDDSVVAGQSIGISGSTGRSTGEHLHVSIKHKKKPVDPDPLIRAICGYANLRKVIDKEKEMKQGKMD